MSEESSSGSSEDEQFYYNYGKYSRQPRKKSRRRVKPNKHMQESTAAQQMVLSTPELLVIILSQLPHSSLLKAQRVNKTWAGLFKHIEIHAALFQQARPGGSALYVEPYSDVLRNRFSTFWPISGEDTASFSELPRPQKTFHPRRWSDFPVAARSGDDAAAVPLQTSTTPQLQPQQSRGNRCPYGQQWRQLLISQPPIKALELVQDVDVRGGGSLEFRTVIFRPDGLRMGLLFDAVRHWHENELSRADLLWNRRCGDLFRDGQTYDDGTSFKTSEDKPCVTIWGHTSVGCGQHGGQTYRDYAYRDAPQLRVIRSGDEEISYCMSQPKRYR